MIDFDLSGNTIQISNHPSGADTRIAPVTAGLVPSGRAGSLIGAGSAGYITTPGIIGEKRSGLIAKDGSTVVRTVISNDGGAITVSSTDGLVSHDGGTLINSLKEA